MFRAAKDRGVVMPLVALMISVFAGFIALGVDSLRLTSADTEKMLGSDTVSLAALREYLDYKVVSGGVVVNANPPHNERYVAAIARATELARANGVTAQYGRRHFQVSDTWDSGLGGGDASAGVIRSGRWWKTAPANCALGTCPCSGPIPCFQTCDAAAGCANPEGGAPLTATAMYVGLRMTEAEDAKLKLYFAAAIGADSIRLSASSTAASGPGSSLASVAPRHIVVLNDLSRFTQMDTYLPGNQADLGIALNAGHINEMAIPLRSCPNPSDPGSFLPRADHQQIWDDIPAANKTVNAPPKYTCLTVNRGGWGPDVTYAMGNHEGLQRVPLPSAYMMEGAYQILNYFDSNATQLDRIGYIGFDEEILPERTINYNATLRTTGFAARTDAAFINMKNANFAIPLSARHNAHLFPRGNYGSDLPLALRRARIALENEPDFLGSDNTVILITNGMASCERLSDGESNPPRCMRWTDIKSNSWDAYWTHIRSLEEAMRVEAIGRYAPQKIRLQIAMFGKSTGPHTVMLRNTAANRCMSDYEIRERGYMNVFWNPDQAAGEAAFANLGKTVFSEPIHYEPARYLYAMARATQGVWAPVRPQCDGMDTINWASLIDQRCDSDSSNPPGILDDTTQSGNYTISEPTWRPDGVVDATGRRIICDPLNRNLLAQVDQTMQDLYAIQPVLLVGG